MHFWGYKRKICRHHEDNYAIWKSLRSFPLSLVWLGKVSAFEGKFTPHVRSLVSFLSFITMVVLKEKYWPSHFTRGRFLRVSLFLFPSCVSHSSQPVSALCKAHLDVLRIGSLKCTLPLRVYLWSVNYFLHLPRALIKSYALNNYTFQPDSPFRSPFSSSAGDII